MKKIVLILFLYAFLPSVFAALTEEEKGSLEEVITNLSVGLAGVVTELLHSYCSTREEASFPASVSSTGAR